MDEDQINPPVDEADVEPRAAAKRSSVGRRAAKGMAWMMLETVAGRVVTGVCQLILAWLLDPSAFALLSMSYTVTMFIGVLQQSGLRDVLVHRHKRFHLWATPAMWMSASTGFGAAILTLAASPLAVWFYGQPELYGMLVIMSLSMPINGWNMIPMARLRSSLNFRVLAINSFLCESGRMVLTVILAWMGFGVYSFVIPMPVVALWSTANLWRIVRPKIEFKLYLRKWKYLASDSFQLVATTMVAALVNMGDYLILGRLASSAGMEYEAGLYFYAVAQSAMVTRVFAMNLRRVLFPTLSQFVGEPARQTAAFLKSSRLLTVTAMPLCMLQAALIEPAVHLLLPIDYWPVIPLAQALSVASAFRVIRGPNVSLLMAQGRFRVNLILIIAQSVVFLSAVFIGGWLDLAFGVAIAVMLVNLLYGPIQTWVALGGGKQQLEASINVFSRPILAALTAGIAAGGLGALVFDLLDSFTVVGHLIYIATVLIVFPVVYVALVRVLVRSDWDELKVQLVRLKDAVLNRMRKVGDS